MAFHSAISKIKFGIEDVISFDSLDQFSDSWHSSDAEMSHDDLEIKIFSDYGV